MTSTQIQAKKPDEGARPPAPEGTALECVACAGMLAEAPE